MYNAIKNQTRTTDQHREAAQKRRLYIDLSGGERIETRAIIERFDGRCFQCGLDLVEDATQRQFDHTLPAVPPLAVDDRERDPPLPRHNGEKAEKWPNVVYPDAELRRLSTLTGIDYATLTAAPHFNPDAVARLQDAGVVDELLTRHVPRMDELIRVRNRLLTATGVDFFAFSRNVSDAWIRRADSARRA